MRTLHRGAQREREAEEEARRAKQELGMVDAELLHEKQAAAEPAAAAAPAPAPKPAVRALACGHACCCAPAPRPVHLLRVPCKCYWTALGHSLKT